MSTTNKRAAKKAAVKKDTSLATAEPMLPDFAKDDVGAGTEGADRDSFAIPFLRVLQSNSPQCEEGNAEYVEGAKRGQLYNSVTNATASEVIFLPCAFQRRYIRWAPRGDVRGYLGELLPEEVNKLVNEGNVQELDGRLYFAKDGKVNEKTCDRLVDTRNHFGLVMFGNETSPALLSLSSTQIKRSKQLLSMLNAVKVRNNDGVLTTPPTWFNRVRITTALESNDQGSWHGVRFELDGFITDPDLYAQGKAFHGSIASGKARASYDAADAHPTGDAEKF